jgi:hypothetical protein
MKDTTENKRNPYQKKIQAWEIEIDEIKNFISKLPDVNTINLPIQLLSQFFGSLDSESLYSEIDDKQEKLKKIKSGVRSMNDTIRHAMIDDSSCAEFGDYVRRLVRLGIEVNVLIDKLPDKNAMKYLQSIINR